MGQVADPCAMQLCEGALFAALYLRCGDIHCDGDEGGLVEALEEEPCRFNPDVAAKLDGVGVLKIDRPQAGGCWV